MTTLRARLADTLRKNWWSNLDDTDTNWADHVADVLLSMPDIAIVELPEVDDSDPDGCQWFSDSSEPGTVGVYPSYIVWGGWEWTAEQAVEVARQWLGAAAFLAAANAAEEQI